MASSSLPLLVTPQSPGSTDAAPRAAPDPAFCLCVFISQSARLGQSCGVVGPCTSATPLFEKPDRGILSRDVCGPLQRLETWKARIWEGMRRVSPEEAPLRLCAVVVVAEGDIRT